MEGAGNANHEVEAPSRITIKGILGLLMENVDTGNGKRVVSLGMGDPSAYTCFRTTRVAEDAVVDALQSQKFNGYSPTVGLPQTRRAIAEYLSRDLPYKLSSDDVFVTSGCTQAIDVALAMLARPGANVLLPRPGFPIYELCAAFRHIEVRHYDLLPNKGWEVDLDAIQTLADRNTVAMVIINPGNPCGNVYTDQHLREIAETAEKLKILVIADEVYGHLAFGDTPFVPMGRYGRIVPVLTLGSLSKRWIVPGWRLGWFVTSDPSGMFRKPKVSCACVWRVHPLAFLAFGFTISKSSCIKLIIHFFAIIEFSFTAFSSLRLLSASRSILTYWEAHQLSSRQRFLKSSTEPMRLSSRKTSTC
ncbi:hypothetical protein EUGRSUZ_F01171 [Eucalyptus grandis]|uniref:Uncharacterized protein n=2 Tax=Eucalyptus grandis TaxID=71139 RepID=A0ACC3KDF3_EUCGR|nr:hypothetical protein EUGRSUZ_F01171 [Eucalyptus grandis]